ncbi:hypothetical protein T492DRAFT_850168 [Pavlovales sp. CCMP2436]|nr:hypothetical protein T492DRAFT_850168 [Pavlovales sp. CCMP2436]
MEAMAMARARAASPVARRAESPSRATTLEARRLLKSTTAMQHSPTLPIYASVRKAHSVSPLSPQDAMRLAQRPVELPSARTLRIDAPAGMGSRSLTLESIEAERHNEKNAWWLTGRGAVHAMPALVEIYEAQIDALLDVATRWKLQLARRRSGLDGQRAPPQRGGFSRESSRRDPLDLGAGVNTEPQFEALHLQAGNVLAELRVTVCRMVQLLQASQRAHEVTP